MSELTKKKVAGRGWIALRATAVLMGILSIWLFWFIANSIGLNHSQFLEFLSQPINAYLMIAFAVLATSHAIMGVHEIVLDYIESKTLQNIKMLSVKIILTLAMLAIIASVVKIAFL